MQTYVIRDSMDQPVYFLMAQWLHEAEIFWGFRYINLITMARIDLDIYIANRYILFKLNFKLLQNRVHLDILKSMMGTGNWTHPKMYVNDFVYQLILELSHSLPQKGEYTKG